MSLAAGRLRHRVTIRRPIYSTNETTGDLTIGWSDVFTNVAAAIEPLSVREFIAAQQMQSQITARIIIRYRAGLTADMQIVHGTKLYQPQGWLSDIDSGLEYLTAPCELLETPYGSSGITADTTQYSADNDILTADAA